MFEQKLLLHEEIAKKICEMIITDEIQQNQRILSVRDFAIELKTNPNTVQKAFAYLERYDIFEASPGRGRFLTNDKRKINKLKREVVKADIKTFLKQMYRYQLPKQELMSLIKKEYKKNQS